MPLQIINTKHISESDYVPTILIISSILLVLALVFVAIMYIHNRLMKSKESRKKRAMNIFQELLYLYINTDINKLEDVEKIEVITQRISNLISDEVYLNIFKETIFTLMKLFEGEIKLKLEKLYNELGLLSLILYNLESKNWRIKLKAVNELKELRMMKSRSKLKNLIEDSNERISISAMQSIMELDQNPFEFLKDYHKPLTMAQSIFISKKASSMNFYKVNDINKLFQHEQNSVKKLGIQMAQILNIKETVHELKKFLAHDDEELKVWAFITIAHLEPQNSFETLYSFCKTDNNSILQQILKISDSQYVRIPSNVINVIKSSISNNISLPLA